MSAVLTASAVGAAAPAGRDQQMVLNAVSYESYARIADLFMDRPGVRINYDGWRLEFMTLSSVHELYRDWVTFLIRMLTLEHGRDVVSFGQMTFRSERLARGAEPDGCFWIAHQPVMQGRRDWNPDQDPPPDLLLEVEISRGALDRMAIWAALRVPEVWRFDGTHFRIELLQPDGTWRESPVSAAFPIVTAQEFLPFVHSGEVGGSGASTLAFCQWVRARLKKPSLNPGAPGA